MNTVKLSFDQILKIHQSNLFNDYDKYIPDRTSNNMQNPFLLQLTLTLVYRPIVMMFSFRFGIYFFFHLKFLTHRR